MVHCLWNQDNEYSKYVFSFHGQWENPWPSSFIDSLNIIDCCVVKINDDANEIVHDVELLNYATHKFVPRDEDIFVNDVRTMYSQKYPCELLL